MSVWGLNFSRKKKHNLMICGKKTPPKLLLLHILPFCEDINFLASEWLAIFPRKKRKQVFCFPEGWDKN